MTANEIAEEIKNLDGPIHQLLVLGERLEEYLEDHPNNMTMHTNRGRLVKVVDLLERMRRSV